MNVSEYMSMLFAICGVIVVYFHFAHRVEEMRQAVADQFNPEVYPNPETACCIWEYMLENREGKFRNGFGSQGVASMRQAAVFAAPTIDILWNRAQELDAFDEPFDWEFVPKVLNKIMDENGDIHYSEFPADDLLIWIGIVQGG